MKKSMAFKGIIWLATYNGPSTTRSGEMEFHSVPTIHIGPGLGFNLG